MSILVQSPFPVFTDTDGTPLDNGYIYVGEVGLNPISNPAQVYWDEELTIPAVNIRTLNGYPSYNGTPGKLFTGSDYSIVVKNTRELVVFTSLSSTEATDGTELTPGRVALGEKISDVTGDGDYVIAQTGVETNEMASGLLQIIVSSATQRGTALLEYGWADGTAEEGVTTFKFLHLQTHVGVEIFTGATLVYNNSTGTGMKIRLGLTEATGTGAMRIRVQKLNIGGNGIAEETPGLELVPATIANNTRTPDGSIGSFLFIVASNSIASTNGNFAVVGTGLSILAGTSALAALSSTDVAFIDSSIEELTTYRWNGSTWSQVGTELLISGVGTPALAALSSTDVAFMDSIIEELRTYRWNGSTWSQVGTGLSITGASYPELTALSSTDVAYIDEGLEELRTYRWNGATWSQVGTGLSITGIDNPELAALSSTEVAFIDQDLEELTTYRWNGSTWSQVGTGLSITGITYPELAALSSTDVAYIDATLEELRTYRWNGSTWSQVGTGLSITGTGTSALAALSSTDVAFIESSSDELRKYTSQLDPPSPAFN